MKKYLKYNHYIYVIVSIVIGIDIVHRTKDIGIFNMFLALYIIMITNDYLRMNIFYKNVKGYFLSILFSIIVSSILMFNMNGFVDVHIYMILHELILFTDGPISKRLVILIIVDMSLLILFRKASIEELLSIKFWINNLLDLIMAYIWNVFYILSLYGYKTSRMGKIKTDKLNKELELSYSKLQEQSKKIEELTIATERKRVAGEIHDNLGHSLISLNMNLDVAAKIIDEDLVKTKELINKSQDLTKESMDSLRKAVYALKEKEAIRLKDSIKDIIDNIEATGKVKVKLDMDEDVESLLQEYKDSIYSSVKEIITNSIKHGKAQEIYIHIKMEDKVIVKVKDNGIGCNDIIKGNGLTGIENSISKFDGSVNYSTGKEGFGISLVFPMPVAVDR